MRPTLHRLREPHQRRHERRQARELHDGLHGQCRGRRLEERADFSARARHHLPHPCQPELHQEPGTRHPRQVPDRPGAGRNLQHGASDRLSDDARGELYDPVARNDDPQREIHLRSGDHRHQRPQPSTVSAPSCCPYRSRAYRPKYRSTNRSGRPICASTAPTRPIPSR